MAIKENLLLNVVLPLAEKVKGTSICKWYGKICEMNTWSNDQILFWQETELQKFIRHSYEHTVYYHRLLDELGLTPDDICKVEDLKKLPVLTRDVVNAHYEEFIPDNLKSFKSRLSRTGGTTGRPMQYYCDEETYGYVTAAKIYYWKQNGYNYGDKFVAFGSASLFSQKPTLVRRVYDVIRQEVPMNSVNLTDQLCDSYAKQIKKGKIRYLYGYAAAIYVFTQYVERNNIDLKQIDAVFTTSENLLDSYRELIERTYECRVVDCYGARDAGITGYEVKRNSYHVGYNSIVEVINEFEPDKGDLVTTNFLNYSFPLIRYNFGDVGELARATNKDEYNGQVLRNIYGRTSDVMRLANGHSITATGLSMIMKQFDIVAFDFQKLSELEVTIRIQPIPTKYNNEQESVILNTIQRYIGDECKLNVQYVNEFIPLQNGKRRYFLVK